MLNVYETRPRSEKAVEVVDRAPGERSSDTTYSQYSFAQHRVADFATLRPNRLPHFAKAQDAISTILRKVSPSVARVGEGM